MHIVYLHANFEEKVDKLTGDLGMDTKTNEGSHFTCLIEGTKRGSGNDLRVQALGRSSGMFPLLICFEKCTE